MRLCLPLLLEAEPQAMGSQSETRNQVMPNAQLPITRKNLNMKLMTTSVNKTIEIQEIGIIITAKKLNVGILSVDFLKTSGVIPQDWELQSKPVKTPSAVQLSFKNGVNLVAHRVKSFSRRRLRKKRLKIFKSRKLLVNTSKNFPMRITRKLL